MQSRKFKKPKTIYFKSIGHITYDSYQKQFDKKVNRMYYKLFLNGYLVQTLHLPN